MLGYQKEQRSLTKEEKEAIGLLSIGTFLEYFDFMLYVHMAVLLNQLFFPEYDSRTASMLSASIFCITFVVRPLGALIFGWIGDNIGRKATVVITTIMMACSCVIMAILPTYNQVGVTASCIMVICRIVQGMSSMGEITGAEIYFTETIKPPLQYVVVSILAFLAALGGVTALGIASFSTVEGFNWRYAFGIGAVIALVGGVARTRLRETPEFADAKRRVQSILEQFGKNPKLVNNNYIVKEKVNKKTILALLLINCGWPVCFYIAFIHCGNILQNSFGYTPDQVIHNNFFVGLVEMLGILPLIYLGYYISPLLILKIRLIIYSIFILACPYLLNNISTPSGIFYFQCFAMFFVLDTTPAKSIFYQYIPIFKRFTYTCFTIAISRAITYVITSFGIIYLVKYFNNFGLLIIMIPIALGTAFAINHFETLGKKTNNY
ncbi:MFS transporter [Rickettsia endosymbiont of Orchestes rusci]|uniref:MFS transporter n=1 Tax=Rickettsia endosymbiont of Orchestes rusci TaxID=3066250 RepID=UPI00313E4B50